MEKQLILVFYILNYFFALTKILRKTFIENREHAVTLNLVSNWQP